MTAPYPWPEGKTSAFCFTVDVDAHSPWMWNNRKNVRPLLSHLEQRYFGPRVGMSRLTDLLERRGIKGSFYVPAVVAEDHPEMLPGLVAKGHEIGLHGYFHEIVAETSDEEFTRVFEASIALFEKQIGRRPTGFRSPAWEMTPHMLAEVKRMGFYDSSLMGFDTPYTIDGVTEVPVQWSTDDAIFFKFLGGGADHWPPVGTDRILAAWREEWQALHRFGGLFMLTVHDWISGRAARVAMLERLLEEVQAADGVWIATVEEIAAYHAANHADTNRVDSHVPASLLDHPVWRQA
jgi:peptidoglycan-N-acetylglucosamine deacetylase